MQVHNFLSKIVSNCAQRNLALSSEFQKRAVETIENYLRILSSTSPYKLHLCDTWRYEREDDFAYGLVVGQLDGPILGYFRRIMIGHLLIKSQEKSKE
jgi:hypothetical protein